MKEKASRGVYGEISDRVDRINSKRWVKNG
jgi:hypothetical protein